MAQVQAGAELDLQLYVRRSYSCVTSHRCIVFHTNAFAPRCTWASGVAGPTCPQETSGCDLSSTEGPGSPYSSHPAEKDLFLLTFLKTKVPYLNLSGLASVLGPSESVIGQAQSHATSHRGLAPASPRPHVLKTEDSVPQRKWGCCCQKGKRMQKQ